VVLVEGNLSHEPVKGFALEARADRLLLAQIALKWIFMGRRVIKYKYFKIEFLF
jgi:hypothetical protein